MNKDLTITIGDNIKYFRTAAGLTQKELASMISGLSEKALAAYEQHVNTPDIETLLNISKQLNIPYSALLDEPYSITTSQFELAPDELKLLLKYRSLPKTKQRSILDILDINK